MLDKKYLKNYIAGLLLKINNLNKLYSYIFLISKSLIFSMLLSGVIYIGLLTIIDFELGNYYGLFYFLLFLVNFIFIYNKEIRLWGLSRNIRINWFLLFSASFLFFYRSPIYFHALDDFVYHMPAGFYFRSMWQSKSFMPLDLTSYLYPFIQVSYDQIISFFGIRISLLVLSFSQLFWYLSINSRLTNYVKNRGVNNSNLIDAVFIFIFFVPELVLTHMTFMSDFYSVLLILEVLLLFVFKKDFYWIALLSIFSVLVKQSTGLFLFPLVILMLYMSFKNVKIKRIISLSLISLLVLSFFVRTYLFTGNPFSFLLNSYFESPLYELVNFRDDRWGPVGFFEIILWPLIGSFSERFIEFRLYSKYIKLFYGLFWIAPLLFSVYIIFFKKSLRHFGFVFVLSIMFWAWQSGYSRYGISLMAFIWVYFLLNINIYYFFQDLVNKYSKLILFILCIMGLLVIRNDVALRGFVLEKFFPPKIGMYFVDRWKEGVKLYFKDNFYNIFNEIQSSYDGYSSVSVIYRGSSTFYAYLGFRYAGLPVYSSMTDDERTMFLDSKKIPFDVKDNYLKMENKKPVLLIVDKDFSYLLPNSYVYMNSVCKKINDVVISSYFQHPNYFGNVERYSCE